MSERTGAQLIEDYRLRQIESGSVPDAVSGGELVGAAICYALVAKPGFATGSGIPAHLTGRYSARLHAQWPPNWDPPGHARNEWLPAPDRVHNLAVAGALLAAEIDRLLAGQPRVSCTRCPEVVPASQIFLHVIEESGIRHNENLCPDCRDAAWLNPVRNQSAQAAQEADLG